ncbi:hypothetical protein XELAEV_18036482mg [Xenopus laevis]|uniref:VWFD domain-containing protein n=1 Tax=Xenopus laevis TaxID=8355 RepID=A0A974HD32_XENLA|nr:hypothetical protein XELAEV_18036482mg [Xenopus laevis]
MTSSIIFQLLLSLSLLCGSSLSIHIGQEFITAFLQHGNYSEPNSNLNITITAFRNKTLVTVTMKQPRFTLPLLLRASETKMIKLPNGAEMVGSGVFNSTVVITSNQDISVTAMNSKSLSSSRIIVHPAEDLGTEYYVVIPSEGTFNNLKEFAVIGYQWPTSVKIFLKGWVMYQGKNYSLAQPLSVELKPGQVFQLQSNNNLSGTRIISTRPVAVLSGDSCTWNKKQCNHVYEQLYPVTSWGKKYVVSPLPFQSGSDIVYVTAWQTTRVNYTSGSLQKRLMVQAGQVVKIPIRTTNPVVLSANVSVQVMFYCTGGVTQGIVFDPFFITIPDVTSYCTSYQVIGLQGYINAVVVTAQTSSLAGLKFNERSLTILKWKTIPGTKYSWAQYRFGRQFKSHLVSHPKMPFVVMSVGLSPKTGYGLTGVCLKQIICPQHSQYNSCGSACPATCMGKPSNCPRPCVETCECHPGFVFSEGKCIPKARCGCVFRGRQYPPNKAFWADNNCKRKCMCNVALQKVLCEDSGCRPGEKCSIKDGVLDCYPISYSYCSVFGDPHYRTFDGAHYDFQGTCRYQLTGLCDLNSGLTEFQVHVVNRNRGVQSASYTRAVWLRVYGTEIMLNRENPGRVLINGLLINLPYSFELDHIRIFKQGWNAVILTKFGMKINFDWFGEVTVTLPQSYAGAVCGLCGNFNDDPQDDMVMKNNQSAPSILAFGLSWRTREMLSGCREQEPDNCTSLIQLENSQRKSFHNCGILINKTGPFQHCHAIINPETYFKDCIYDSCFYKERQDIFCQVIETYSGTCQDAGVTLLNWRNETFCKPWCPANGHYDLCSNGCPMTCSSLSAPRGCKKFCKEGCVCDDGFILDVDVCVPISQCGCVFNGLYYKVNDTFYPSNNCLQQCVCHPGGNVVCTPFACGPNEACRLLNGIRKCHPTGSAWCSVVGGPHFHTFDGLTYDFQGNCSYTLSKSCGKDPLPVFSIRVKIEKSGNKMAFITKSLVVDVADIQFVMMQGKPGMVQVNSNVFNLPLNLGNRGIWVFQHGLKVGLRTAFGLQVTYDLNHEVLLYISSSYYGQVCGLCGNYNGNSKDEFQLPDGSLASEVTTFGSAWQEKLPGTICNSGCGSPGNPCPACPQQSLYEKEAFCGVLLTEGGPFTPCRDRVDPTVYISNCVSDLCRAGGNISALCYSIQSYVSVCQNAGITDIQWRTKDFCPLKCNLNSHYEACADTCANSCSRFTSPVLCPNECSEGCECNENYYLNGATCVLMEKCGCNIEGRYYKIAEIFLNDHCTKICTCQANGSVTCQNYSCKKNCILETDRSIRCSDVKGVSVK